MGGHVLELESEKRARLMAEAKEQAEALGREQGMAQGIAQGMAQGEERLSVLINRLMIVVMRFRRLLQIKKCVKPCTENISYNWKG